MITGWVIYKEEDKKRNETFISWMQEAASRRGMILEVVTYESLAVTLSGREAMFPGRPKPDFLVVRTCTPWLNEAAEMRGIRVFNCSKVSRIANDKRLSHAYMNCLGIPMLPSTAAHRKSLHYMSPSYPFILKDPFGRGGTGVEWIARPQQLNRTLKDELLMQPVGGQRGRDVRVYVVGGKIAGSILRESQTDFKANISGGANAVFYELSDADKAVVHTITASLKLDFAGLDFLLDEEDGLLFNEMEDAVGCRSLYMNSSVDIADVFMEHVFSELV
ncbi:ATP-grasp domain-containing protein [Alkalicoccus halolimnae]|uniref:ATP-grasp domain-containing protein n=1 Tax=Alkalicoccus halolimnae TaxID=1667239 RepID=A0A5C7FM57_9BACI|nr:hypothetical protein [Alkalicoccus halolimnae]TXF85825.1 hypothetical protein FTX54_07030 [Alkalicoccus halolimnae]